MYGRFSCVGGETAVKKMITDEKQYASYLLRLWQVEKNGEQVWRASLESAQTGEKQLFAFFDDLVAFLQQEMINSLDLSLTKVNHKQDESAN